VTPLVGSSIAWPKYGLSLVQLALAGSLAAAMRKRAPNGWLRVVPASIVFLAAAAMLRDSAGGMSSGAGALSLIPVFYAALYGRSRGELGLVLAGMAVFYMAPIILIGGTAYPSQQYRAALLMLSVSSIIGLVTQRLVADVRRQAGAARSRERMLREVSQVVAGLYGSRHARVDVCEAAKMISGATVAVLWEQVAETGTLRTTAMAGIDTAPLEIALDRTSSVNHAFRSGHATLLTHDARAQVGFPELWAAAGHPRSILYQPLLDGGTPVGVLVVGWADSIEREGARTHVVTLLAHQAAAVIARADAVENLTDMARNDALTGLPNRRVWEEHLMRVSDSEQTAAIAMLDLDHFKQFNDAHGHLAGDRLLKETAAAWRDELRAGDLLTRLGGEEFGLLIVERNVETAVEVVERLRARVAAGRTCSAGIAIRRPGEHIDGVVARADHALYEAKAAGRDRVHVNAAESAPGASGEVHSLDALH
jgi:diguanylate cyclase (GGDEF)-like protein